MARWPPAKLSSARSDVDLLTIDVPRADAAAIAAKLSARHRHVCRAVEIGPAASDDFSRPDDESYGNRVFLRHYCVHLVGPVHPIEPRGFPADAWAARGFNGDIADHARRWHAAVAAPEHRRTCRTGKSRPNPQDRIGAM